MNKERSRSETFLMDTFSDTMYLILYAAGHQPSPQSDLEGAFFEVAVYNFLEGFENVLYYSRPEDQSFIDEASKMLERELEEGSHLCYPNFEKNLLEIMIMADASPSCRAFFKRALDRIRPLKQVGE